MRIRYSWPADSRIIEFGARNGKLGNQLVRAGCDHFLSVVNDDETLRKIASSHSRLKNHLVVSSGRKAIRQNNAQVLVLNDRSQLYLAQYRSIRHALIIAIPARPTPYFLLAAMFGLFQCLLGRLAWPKVKGGREGDAAWPKLFVFTVCHPRPHTAARRFIPHRLGVEGFLFRVQDHGARHAVLRWFDKLPEIADGEDLDLLVDDSSLEFVRDLLDKGPGVQPVDLYSAGELPGADYREMPYFPPRQAEQLLADAQLLCGVCAVPSAHDHLFSLAYHALYHKGFASGIPSQFGRRRLRRAPEHDYPAVLDDLARRLGMEVRVTMEDLDRMLDAHHWRPPNDMLVRLSRRNRWIQLLLDQQKAEDEDRGLAVFLLRSEALHRGGVEKAVQLLQQHGFCIVESRLFTPKHSRSLAQSVRGGNWGRGPWSVSGGPPVAAIIVYDMDPTTPTRSQKKRFPFVTNSRLLVKQDIRDAFNAGYPQDQHCNVVHSSDNGREALDYFRLIMPEKIDEITTFDN